MMRAEYIDNRTAQMVAVADALRRTSPEAARDYADKARLRLSMELAALYPREAA